jgi:DnaJ-class molecular chaperone
MATLESIEDQIDALNDKMDTKFDEMDLKFDALILHRTCTVCHGSGEVNSPVEGEPGPPYECPLCGGDGSVKAGYIDTTDE